MTSKKYDSFRDLKKGKYDWNVTARIMNMWRGYTNQGDPFQSFNLLLIDNKRSRIHAFVPGNVACKIESTLQVGSIYNFKNFTVREYKLDDKFRHLIKDIQIVFSNETKIPDMDENEMFIEQAVFDFYDLGELNNISKQTTYLTDVIGVIKIPVPTLSRFTNKLNHEQRNSVKVTFWDAFAELFAEALKEEYEYPFIITIGSARIQEWNNDVSHVGATTFYLNYNHHSVGQLRKMLKEDMFCDCELTRRRIV
ncbi:uncharacterized protein LOC141712101 [Apium graveolens]|uniref:uncharacterized protein LOC141712101 n=1 Tax=Apium graveolens TaxID=4045 RepID=UPI003D79E0CC